MAAPSAPAAEGVPPTKPSALEAIAVELESRLLYRAEGGAFEGKLEERDKINELIKRARALEPTDNAAARSDLLLATMMLADTVRSKGLKWQMIHIWGLIPFSYLMILGIASLYLTFKWTTEILEISLLNVPLAAVVYSFMGGVLRGLWYLYKKVEKKHFRLQFTMPYIVGPWIAALLGILVWLLIKAGLILLSGGDSTLQPLAVYALVFIGGFSWEWVMDMVALVKSKTSQN